MNLVELTAFLYDRGLRSRASVAHWAKTNDNDPPCVIAGVLAAYETYASVLNRLDRRAPDATWPFHRDIGMPRDDLRRMLAAFHAAVIARGEDCPDGHGLLWAARVCPEHTAVLDLLHDTDDCLSLRCEEVTTPQFEACRGRRYRVTSPYAWSTRPPYWRTLLPDPECAS